MTFDTRLAGLVRIATGALFVAEGYGKATGPFVHGAFAKSAESMAREAWPFWRSFLRSVVLPHAQTFGWVVAIGELALGIALLLGFWTRPAAAAGVLLLLTILLGQTYMPGSGWVDWVTAGLTTKFAILLLLSIAAAGYGAWGLDSLRRGKVRMGFR
jgi:uncharacterized membrane protein YphA (DoxX/SURF4 family)